MKKIYLFMIPLMMLAACQSKPQEPGYIVQVSLGGWNAPDYTAEQVIGRIQDVNALIPVRKVIIGWSLDKQVYRQVGEYLHANGIKMLLWLPVFAETEEMCDNEPAVDLAGEIPANYDLAAGEGGVDVELVVDFRGPLLESGEPREDEQDFLSAAIIKGLVDHWEQPEPGLVRLYLKNEH